MVTKREELFISLLSFAITFAESILMAIVPTGLLLIICYFFSLPTIAGRGICFIAILFALVRAIKEVWFDLTEYHKMFGGPESELDEEVRRPGWKNGNKD